MKRIICVLFLTLFLLTSCGEVYRYTNETYFAMNTTVNVIADESIDSDPTPYVLGDVEKRFSRTIPESEISRLNRGENAALSEDTLYVVERALEIADSTDCAFNPCMGTLTDLWDITSGKNIVPSDEDIKNALFFCDVSCAYVDDTKVLLPDGMRIDLGGIAKGYALEKAYEEMRKTAEEKGVSPDFCISIGGNIAVSGSSSKNRKNGKGGWDVGITNPFDKNTTLGSLHLNEGFVSVSGAYERFFEKDGKIYHHIFDSKTGYPSDSDLASAVVISDDGLVGDALSTALFVMGKDRAVEFYKEGKYSFEMVLISKNGVVSVTKGIKDRFDFDEQAVSDGLNKLKLEIIQ